MKYLGDIAEDAIIDFKFSSHDAEGTPTALVDGVVKVYKGNATDTEATAGVTLTADFDSVTGLNHVRIDTSADAFYAVANDYSVVLTAGTVDSVSVVGTVLALFSIENRTAFPKADYPTNFSALGIESDGDLTKVNTLDGHTPQTGDVYAIANSVTHGNAALKSLIDTVDTVADAIKAKTDNLKASWNDLDAAGVRTALGMASANLDTQLSGIGGYVDCLPASWVVPATAAEVAAVQTHGDSTWATATGFSTHSVNDIVTALQAVAADFKATGYATAENLAAAKAILDKLDGLVEVIA